MPGIHSPTGTQARIPLVQNLAVDLLFVLDLAAESRSCRCIVRAAPTNVVNFAAAETFSVSTILNGLPKSWFESKGLPAGALGRAPCPRQLRPRTDS